MLVHERLLEEAADELGRLEAISAYAPTGVALALRSAAIARLVTAGPDSDAVATFASLAAAEGDPLHDGELPSHALHWRALVETEERRVRGGAPLTSQRFAIVAPALATYTERPRLEAIWRETGLTRAVLHRALDAAAWSPSPALGDACAALMLCAGGRTDRVRFLPFADTDPSVRVDATARWRAGDESAWSEAGLEAAARRARVLRRGIDELLRGLGAEDARLDTLGRAAITARRALHAVRERFVVTMPSLAEALELSRPAATDALDRLVAAGLARELTGRARDRVYAWTAACVVAEARVAS